MTKIEIVDIIRDEYKLSTGKNSATTTKQRQEKPAITINYALITRLQLTTIKYDRNTYSKPLSLS